MNQDVVTTERQEVPDPERPLDDARAAVDGAMPAAAANADPGERLKAARLGMGMSVADVARHLKLQPRQVEALERGDHQALPGQVFVRGFMRNYARLVGLEPDMLVGAAARSATSGAEVAEAVKRRAAVWTSGTQGPVFEEGAARARKRWWPVTVGLIMFAAVLLYLGRERIYPDAPGEGAMVPAGEATGEQTRGAPSGADTGEATTGAQGDPATAPPATSEPARADVAQAEVSPVSGGAVANPVPASKEPEVAARTSAPESVPALATGGAAPAPRAGDAAAGAGQLLRLSFTQDSWVEVRDGSGAVVFSQMGTAGSERTVRGQPPLRLTVGNASGVRVNFRSRDVDLAPHTQSEVAHVTLE